MPITEPTEVDPICSVIHRSSGHVITINRCVYTRRDDLFKTEVCRPESGTSVSRVLENHSLIWRICGHNYTLRTPVMYTVMDLKQIWWPGNTVMMSNRALRKGCNRRLQVAYWIIEIFIISILHKGGWDGRGIQNAWSRCEKCTSLVGQTKGKKSPGILGTVILQQFSRYIQRM
jgi:hypothetical protein